MNEYEGQAGLFSETTTARLSTAVCRRPSSLPFTTAFRTPLIVPLFRSRQSAHLELDFSTGRRAVLVATLLAD
eukprot:6197661-Pleurochrysis_carterae.AAC.4